MVGYGKKKVAYLLSRMGYMYLDLILVLIQIIALSGCHQQMVVG